LTWARRELNALNIPPLKRFGQHFLVDERIRDALIDCAELTASDSVLEVGPGLGFLTSSLISKAGRVIAIEKDHTLASYLQKKYASARNLTVIQGDVLRITVPTFTKMVSSPPYNISSKLVFLLLRTNFQLASLLLQDEFARRLTAAASSRDYGRLSVMFQCQAKADLVMKVARSSFYPRPRVDSALVTLRSIEPRVMDLESFSDLVRTLFTQRRRKMRAVLAKYLKSRYPNKYDCILRQISSRLEKRIYEVNPEEFADLSNRIIEIAAECDADAS